MTTPSLVESRPTLILYTVAFHESERERAGALGLDLYEELTRPKEDPLAFGASIPVFCAAAPENVSLEGAEIVVVIPVLGALAFSLERDATVARLREWYEKLGPGHVLPVPLDDVW